jgi:hypothetical protein
LGTLAVTTSGEVQHPPSAADTAARTTVVRTLLVIDLMVLPQPPSRQSMMKPK